MSGHLHSIPKPDPDGESGSGSPGAPVPPREEFDVTIKIDGVDRVVRAKTSPTAPQITMVGYSHPAIPGRVYFLASGDAFEWRAHLQVAFDHFGQKGVADLNINSETYARAGVTCIEEAIAVTAAVLEKLRDRVIREAKIALEKQKVNSDKNGHKPKPKQK